MTELRLEGVCKHFGGVEAVADLSLAVPRGRITGLIGPNGAGKSTVVNLVTGMLKVSSGRILLGGTEITRDRPEAVARAGVARTFQNIRLLQELSVLDNVVVGFHRHERTGLLENLVGWPSTRREKAAFVARAEALLRRFSMEGDRDRLAGGLSYGHQRRVEMMRALALGPEILLLDEPVAGMNDVEAAELGLIFRELAEEGVGILLIEHNVRFVRALCSHVYVINTGRLIAEGSADAVCSDQAVIDAYLGT